MSFPCFIKARGDFRKRLLGVLLAMLQTWCFGQKTTEDYAVSKNMLKTALIFHFTKHIHWDNVQQLKEFRIGVLGEHQDLIKELSVLQKEHKVNNLPIAIVQFNNVDEIGHTEILYVNGNDKFDQDHIFEKISTNHTLLVSENMEDFQKSMINFVTIKNTQKFSINQKIIENQGLKVGHELLRVAIVKESDWKDIYAKFEDLLNSDKSEVILDRSELKQIIHKRKLLQDELQKVNRTIEVQHQALQEKEKVIRGLYFKANQEEQEILTQTIKIQHQEQNLEALIQEGRRHQQELSEKAALLAQQDEQLRLHALDIAFKKSEIVKQSDLLAKQNANIATQNHKSEVQQKIITNQLKEINAQNSLLNLQVGKLKIQKLSIVLFLFIIALVGGFVVYLYRSNGAKQKAYKLLEEQKKQIENKNAELLVLNNEIDQQRQEMENKSDEIEGSLVYARYIQKAFMPQKEDLQRLFEHNALFFKSAQTVTGSFYYLKKVDNKSLIFVGSSNLPSVPGSFISMICYETLEEHLNEGSIVINKLLKQLDQSIKNALPRNSSDSIDIAIACVNHTTRIVETLGANIRFLFVKADTQQPKIVEPVYHSFGYKKQAFNQFPKEIDFAKGDRLFVVNNGLLHHIPMTELVQMVTETTDLKAIKKQIAEQTAANQKKEDLLLLGVEL